MKAKFKSIFKTRLRLALFVLVLLIVIVGLWHWLRADKTAGELYVVTPMTVSQTIALSGKVVPSAQAELAFETAGRIAAVPGQPGTLVKAGDPIISLALDTLPAQLAAAQSTLALKRAQTGSTRVNLAEITNEQDTLVAGAFSKLLSSDLVAEPQSANYNLTAPTISGRYSGPAGTYKVIIRNDSRSASDAELRTFGLEETPLITISDTAPTPLGTRGLFISFPDELNNYAETVWYVNLPNPKGDSYLANRNAYDEAVRTRTRAIAEAESDLAQATSGSTVAEAEEQGALAELARIQAEMALRTIRSPIDGVVTTQDARVGELATAGTVLARVISNNNFEIEVQIPETAVGKLGVGNEGLMTLDAYGEARQYAVRLRRVDQGEQVVAGVPTYKGVLDLVASTTDDTIKSGMTANVTIVAAEKDNVLAVPTKAVHYKNGQASVTIVADDQPAAERPVQVGLEGTNGLVEITSGLQSGEKIEIAK